MTEEKNRQKARPRKIRLTKNHEVTLQKWELVLDEIEKKIHPLSVMASPEIQDVIKMLKQTGHPNLMVRQFMYLFDRFEIISFDI